MFERIIRDPRFAAVVRLLDIQYRMHHSISDWASENMYHGAIVSHESVAHHTLRDIIGTRRDPITSTSTEGNDTGNCKVQDAEDGSDCDEDDDSIDTLGDIAASVDNASLENDEDAYPVMLLVDTSGLGMLEDSTVSSGGSASAGTGASSGNKKAGGGGGSS